MLSLGQQFPIIFSNQCICWHLCMQTSSYDLHGFVLVILTFSQLNFYMPKPVCSPHKLHTNFYLRSALLIDAAYVHNIEMQCKSKILAKKWKNSKQKVKLFFVKVTCFNVCLWCLNQCMKIFQCLYSNWIFDEYWITTDTYLTQILEWIDYRLICVLLW